MCEEIMTMSSCLVWSNDIVVEKSICVYFHLFWKLCDIKYIDRISLRLLYLACLFLSIEMSIKMLRARTQLREKDNLKTETPKYQNHMNGNCEYLFCAGNTLALWIKRIPRIFLSWGMHTPQDDKEWWSG